MPKLFYRLLAITIAILLLVGIFQIPSVHARLAWRVDALRTNIAYFFRPPDEALFRPAQQSATETVVGARPPVQLPSSTPAVTATSKLGPTPKPAIQATPLPAAVSLPGIIYVDQHGRWNYCGPANLSMALNFWGWKGNRDDIGKVVKPGDGNLKEDFVQQGKADKNVMPYELVAFVNEQTSFRALMRYGGDEALLKRLIAAGFPVIAEKGYYEKDYRGKIDWLGHYLFTTGYDDAKGGFIVQDTWLVPGKNVFSDYETYLEGWRSFNYLFLIVYPSEREDDVMQLLGPWADETWAKQHALEIAQKETHTLTDLDLFFAWFNKGTSHVALQEYAEAASAYDQAFTLYANLDQETHHRPFRMMWYQTGPYFAYFYTGRYQDVINLANTTLNETIAEPTLEESLIWRGRSFSMLGDPQAAIDDYRAALKVHTEWQPALQALQDLGVQP
jgi:tetratricopeptide (TPR) repeat protein